MTDLEKRLKNDNSRLRRINVELQGKLDKATRLLGQFMHEEWERLRVELREEIRGAIGRKTGDDHLTPRRNVEDLDGDQEQAGSTRQIRWTLPGDTD